MGFWAAASVWKRGGRYSRVKRAVLMRGAGCVVNDIADRDFDRRVARTALRPIASGAVSVRQALAFLALLLAIGLAILATLNPVAVAVGAASLPLIAFVYEGWGFDTLFRLLALTAFAILVTVACLPRTLPTPEQALAPAE